MRKTRNQEQISTEARRLSIKASADKIGKP